VITIRTQREWDELPELFDEFTVIEIRSEEWVKIRKTPENSRVEAWGSSRVEARGSSRVEARGSSRVEAWGSSHVEAWGFSRVVAWGSSRVEARGSSRVEARGSSRVEAWGSSHVEAWGFSRVVAWGSSRVTAWGSSVCDNGSTNTQIQAGDNSTLYLNVEPAHFKAEDTVNIIREFISPSFERWLSRGWVVADGIRQKLVSKKSLGNITIYTTEDFWGETFYVAQLGDKFAHANSIEEAKNDLRYKISDRDKSHYESWTLETSAKVDDMIEAYRVITGACSTGTKMFCEGRELKDDYTVKEVIDLTKGQYASEQFSQFFKSKQGEFLAKINGGEK